MKQLLVSTILLMSSISFGHKFYVSIAEMEYDDKEKRIEVSLKMTAHDFEHVLEDKFDEHIHIEKYSDTSNVMLYAIEYVSENFKIYSDDKECRFGFIGKEVDLNDDLFFYFAFEKVKNPATIQIVNTLLFSLSDQQQNIVHYKYKDRTKSVTLVPTQSRAQISFD